MVKCFGAIPLNKCSGLLVYTLVGGGTDGASVNIGQHKSIKEGFRNLYHGCFGHDAIHIG